MQIIIIFITNSFYSIYHKLLYKNILKTSFFLFIIFFTINFNKLYKQYFLIYAHKNSFFLLNTKYIFIFVYRIIKGF